MGFFSREPGKSDLQGIKDITVLGSRFKIKKVNPLLDFTNETMPQIFTDFVTRRKRDAGIGDKIAESRRVLKDIAAMLQAGIVQPKLVPVAAGPEKGNETGVTVDDLMRDTDMATALYWEIVVHSLNRFKGIRGLFFSIRLRHALWILSRNDMVAAPPISPSVQVSSV